LPTFRNWPAIAFTSLLRSPILARCVQMLIGRFPRLQNRLQGIVSKLQYRMNRTGGFGKAHSLLAGQHLPRSTRLVYEQLKAFRTN
jgi:hypothetical protein